MFEKLVEHGEKVLKISKSLVIIIVKKKFMCEF